MTEFFFLSPAPLSALLCYPLHMNSHKEIQPSVNGSSSNAAATHYSLSISDHLGSLLNLIARKLCRLEPLMEKQPDLRQITSIQDFPWQEAGAGAFASRRRE
jgi:hypothetical protein